MTPALVLTGVGGLALLAAAFTHGHHVGGLQARAALLALPIRRATWTALFRDLNGRGSGSRPAPEATASQRGARNALHELRLRRGFGLSDVARALGIPDAELETLERTPLPLLELDAVERFAAALGCRLDVVAQHVDGEAVFLEVRP